MKYNKPLPQREKMKNKEKKIAIYSSLLLIIPLILGVIGILLPINKKELNSYLWFYYIPSIIISAICILIYFRKYFDEVIAISTNHDIFHYIKKKAGAFHAD